MSQNLKVLAQLFAILAVCGAAVAWGFPQADVFVWCMRFGLTILSAAIGWILIREARRKEILRDLLLETSPDYFEHDGVCFNFVPAVDRRIFWIKLFFQNRYERSCNARFVLRPHIRLTTGKQSFETIDIDVVVEGAAFGVVTIPIALPIEAQGKLIHCDVMSETSYPAGRGKLLRYRSGIQVGSPSLFSAGRAGLAVLGLFAGAIVTSRRAQLSMRLPTDVSESLSEELQTESELLWVPDPPAVEFPVVLNSNRTTE